MSTVYISNYILRDATLRSNLEVYRDLVYDYNKNSKDFLCINEEYETLVKIVSKLTHLICRIEKLSHKHQGMISTPCVLQIIRTGIPRGFTEFGMLVNTGEHELVYRVINIFNHHIDLSCDVPSKFVVLHQKKLPVNNKIGEELPIMIAFRNRYIDMMGVIAHFRKKTNFRLVKEFREPWLSEKHFKDLKIYNFVKKHYPSYHQPCHVYGGRTVVEKTLTFAYKIGYIDLIEHFLALESESKICDEYVWRKLVYYSLVEDDILIFCYFVQVGLHIDNFHLKHIVKSKETKIGFQRNTLLELVYLSGAPLTLSQLLLFSNDEENNILEFYSCNPLTLGNCCRILLRKLFRHILPDNSSIFKIIHELNLPKTLVSFLKMDDFLHKHLDI